MKKSTARRKKSRKKEERKMEMESKREKRGEGRIGKGEEVKKEPERRSTDEWISKR